MSSTCDHASYTYIITYVTCESHIKTHMSCIYYLIHTFVLYVAGQLGPVWKLSYLFARTKFIRHTPSQAVVHQPKACLYCRKFVCHTPSQAVVHQPKTCFYYRKFVRYTPSQAVFH